MLVPASPDTELQGTVKRASPWRVADPVNVANWSFDATTGSRCEPAKSKRYQTRWWLCCSARSLLPRRATNTDRFAALAPWVCVEVRLRDDVAWPEGLLQDGQQAHARRASVLVRLAAAATGLLRRALRCLSTASRYARAASSPSRSVPVTSPAPCAPPRSAGELTLRDR